MSTRCQVIVKDQEVEQWFYKHSDGYPEGTMPQLELFLKWVKEGTIRDNVEQSCGWLIIIGAIEYQTLQEGLFTESDKKSYERNDKKVFEALTTFSPKDWKVGSFEPCPPEQHGDIEYLYTIDLDKQEITYVKA